MDLKWNPAAVAQAQHEETQQQQQRAASLERNRHNFFMDGPGRLTSALQLISAAAAVASKRSSSTPPPNSEPPSSHHRGFPSHHQQLSNASSAHSLHQDDDEDEQPAAATMATTVVKTARTIVASDNEVSNGFVKDGKRLPYVFEATESGARKRSSKILPVCGVCGKRFVCVTTMKRHLVTHTGEKPFSCKVCGKQYTQKGNLRVHERTHRNDRPFECNICSQKFYRKEPMQKHQWRQHGIVHFKGRPPGCLESNNLPTPAGATTPPMGPPETSGVLYNTIVDRIKQQSFETRGESSRHLDGPPPPPPPQVELPRLPQQEPKEEQQRPLFLQQPENLSTRPPLQRLPLPLSLSLSSVPLPLDLKQRQQQAPLTPPPSQSPPSVSITATASSPSTTSASAVPNQAAAASEQQPQEFKHAKLLSFEPARQQAQQPAVTISIPFSSTSSNNSSAVSLPKMSPAAQLVSAAMAELNNINNPTMNMTTTKTTTDETRPPTSNMRLLTALQIPAANNNNDTNNALTTTQTTNDNNDDDDKTSETSDKTTTHNPLRMKKMLAHAYQAEQEAEQQQRDEDMREVAEQSPPSPADVDSDSSSTGTPPASFSSASKEIVECQCKSCGHVFVVQDPYNFRCGHCGVKYTSLPTHMIADPMQCIGCCEVFPHKPALKAHQVNKTEGDKERPFRCCKCGYSFRQKAHLQKHQWRIHRRKLEDEPGKPRTASESSSGSSTPFTVTLQDIIDRGVEHSMSKPSPVVIPTNSSGGDNSQPLDLSPTKSLLLSSPSPLKTSSSSPPSSSSSSIMLSTGGIGLATLASSLPAVHNQNHPLPMIVTDTSSSSSDAKRPRTDATPIASPSGSWRSSGPASPTEILAKNKYVREQMGGMRPGTDVRTV